MSRFLRLFAIAALLFGVVATPIVAAEGDAGGAKKEKKAGAINLEITKVDAAAKTVTGKVKDEEKTFTVNDSTTITIDGAAGAIDGLKEGQKAKVTADAAGLASKIEVGKAAKKEKEAK